MFESLYRHDGWGVGIIRGPIEAVLQQRVPSVEWLPLANRRGFAADPFLIEQDGGVFCFFETLPYATNRGKIAYARVDPAGTAGTVTDAIVAPFHLSYPYLLRYDGEILCVPEASAGGAVTAYAARNFPDGWYAKRTVLELPVVDPTIFQHDGRWWMLGTDGRSGWNEQLYAWYADDLFGRWQPHDANPIKRGLYGTRPAGRPFTIDGRWFRPAQDCTGRYGGRIVIQEILDLTPAVFAERETTTLEADPAGPFADGMHTINTCGDITVVDGNHLHFVAQQCVRAIVRKIETMTGR